MTDTPSAADRAAARGELITDLVLANHILFRERVLDGFGHVSARDPEHADRFLMSRNRAPGNVTAEDILVYGLDGEPVDPRGHKLYLERYLHSALYAARPDVNAIVHSHSPAVIPFGITDVGMRPVCHTAGFLGGTVPVFEIREVAGPASDLLIRTQALGVSLAKALGNRPVVLMRGHGSTAVGNSIPQAVYHAIYTEVNARLQSDALRLGAVNFLTPEEAKATAATNDGVIPRIWELWKAQAQQGR